MSRHTFYKMQLPFELEQFSREGWSSCRVDLPLQARLLLVKLVGWSEIWATFLVCHEALAQFENTALESARESAYFLASNGRRDLPDLAEEYSLVGHLPGESAYRAGGIFVFTF